MANLFTYGSLMCSDIFSKVAGCQAEFTEATLYNFFRSKIRSREYPGIIPRPETSVPGILYFNLSSQALERLDAFEGELYLRENVQVMTEHRVFVSAMTYVIKPQHRDILTDKAWSYNEFLAVGKAKFEETYFGFDEF
jgi:gamma-glutamylcyclotransferase (GGCT)/AIG2-like uncharacterized protein YtfP